MKRNPILKQSFDFLNKFAYEYIVSMLKFILIGVIGLIFVSLAKANPIFALCLLFITIPAFCYSFWKGYVVTYGLNFAALDYITKSPLKPFKKYVELAFEQEKGLIGFVSFMAIITALGFIPSCIYFANNISVEQLIIDPLEAIIDSKSIIIFLIINSAILAQFINFSLQAFFFKKQENYFVLLINCYKNTGLGGFIISNIIVGFVSLIGFKAPIIYAIIFLPLNLLIYSINMFWYYSKTKH